MRIGCPFRHHARAVDAREARAGNDAFTGHAPVRAFEMRPEGELFRCDRAKINMAGLRRYWGEPSVRLDQRGDAESGAWPQKSLAVRRPRT